MQLARNWQAQRFKATEGRPVTCNADIGKPSVRTYSCLNLEPDMNF